VSIEALNWALGHMQRDDVESSTAFVLMILANRADPEGICWPSVKYICARTKLADSTVRAACKRIRDLGLLEIEQVTRSDGGSGTNRYKLCISIPPPPIADRGVPPAAGTPSHRTSVEVPPAIGGNTKEDTSLPDGRETRSPKGPKKFVYPDDFKVSADVLTWATERGLSEAYVNEQLEAFRDDARANRRLHADWDCAFRNWLRRQPLFDKSAPRPVKGAKAPPQSAADKRCVWPGRESTLRCGVTSDQDPEGSWIGGGRFMCAKHVRERLDRERKAEGATA